MNKTLYFVVILLFFGEYLSSAQTINYRPDYHYTSPKNWVNDPNGLVYLDGEYHLFYQYNPFGDKWGHMSWGHAVSKDLQNWQTLALALPEFDNNDGSQTMIFSGCVVVDSLNTSGFFPKNFKKGLVAAFTSNVVKNEKGIAQHQSLAYSSDKGRTWKRYDKNPVLDIGISDFRDPNIIWYPERGVWIMTLVKALEFTVQFYESKDLKKWDLLSEFGKQGDMSRVWECPSLIRVPIENSKETKWVLMLSSGHRQPNYLAMQYFVGDFDGKNFISQKQNEILYLDEGKDFYAAIPYFNLPKSQKKPIIIGWLNDWEYARDIPTSGFRGSFSVPRTLHLKMTNEGFRLIQKPILLEKQVVFEKNNFDLKKPFPLAYKGKSYELETKIELKDAKFVGIDLLKSGEEKSVLSYDVAKNELSFDRTKSGNIGFNERFRSLESIKVLPQNGVLNLHILVDNSVIEIFANDGEKAMTDLVFPTKSEGIIEVFAKGGEAKIKSLKIWKIK